MKDSEIINLVTRQLKQLKKDSSTQAGQAKPIDEKTLLAINETFEAFRVNYHNQFLKAYPDLETLNFAKRLWLGHLQNYDAARIKNASRHILTKSDFLPSIHSFLKTLDDVTLYGLPDAHSAYMEACRAPKPKIEFNWSHEAVYYAGLASDWFYLANTIESRALPIFKRNYEMLCERVIKGEDLKMPVLKALPQEISIPVSIKENKKNLSALRKSLDL